MEFQVFDNYKQAIVKSCEALSCNESYLAGMLGVTERSLGAWKKLGGGDGTPKAKRAKLLYEVLRYIHTHHKDIDPTEYKSFLENARVVVDPDDDEDGSVSLLNVIISNPDETYWAAIVEQAKKDYAEED